MTSVEAVAMACWSWLPQVAASYVGYLMALALLGPRLGFQRALLFMNWLRPPWQDLRVARFITPTPQQAEPDEDVTIETPDGLALAAWFLHAPGGPNRPYILFLHGNAVRACPGRERLFLGTHETCSRKHVRRFTVQDSRRPLTGNDANPRAIEASPIVFEPSKCCGATLMPMFSPSTIVVRWKATPLDHPDAGRLSQLNSFAGRVCHSHDCCMDQRYSGLT
ncbi:uncharacterized protein MONBRDRAFT_7220 [Monosiga brevicollis MX1]|uniref:Uncharacterized protein n=1 Tax=Monosiga brevicollis TaxID=81824 RepID=A9UWB2_MONBE|nr:uncharacterized protein MONBRDRAFT_7220 [Monosiga brevicollis MX1]EDQ90736.1 predicted protein [Monosiga brevicollis MX1]|eukprot:XP_001744787.1 hypothetical protein [Monosiga brevicollis MX1]